MKIVLLIFVLALIEFGVGSYWKATDKPRVIVLTDIENEPDDAPDILQKLQVYIIGGPNKKWSPGAYQYIVTHHPNLLIIESNATYRGWFVGGNQSGEWGNSAFVRENIAGHGMLGNFFTTQLGDIKMGDSPSVARFLYGDPEDPSQPNWWTDDPSPDVAEGDHTGAKTVNRWREDFLSDFKERMNQCRSLTKN